MLSAVNLSLAERRIAAQFVSIIYAVWDDERRTLLVANYRSGSIAVLPVGADGRLAAVQYEL